MNATTLNLTIENRTGKLKSQPICYHLLCQFAALFIGPDWKSWSDSFKNEIPQLPYYLCHQVEIFFKDLAQLTLN